MHDTLLTLLRCPFCGGRLTLEENAALTRVGDRIDTGVIWCECCAYPIVAGIPVMRADEATRAAIQALESGDRAGALAGLLGADDSRRSAFDALVARGTDVTYRDALSVLSPDPEGTYFLYRFSDPTFVMAEAVLRSLAQDPGAYTGRVLDLCGGSGHLTRVLCGLRPDHDVVLADMFFWKLWLASTITAPGCQPVCCDANLPLPFARGSFPAVVLSDAFPYIWQKRLLAEEMVRLAGGDGLIVMPHLHSSLGENFSAGMTLTPAAYRELFQALEPRLFSDAALLTQAIEGHGLDLGRDVTPDDLGHQPSFTLVATRNSRTFRRYQPLTPQPVSGVLAVNPLYAVARRGWASELVLEFPTEEYAEEFAECRRYLPDTLTLDADLSGAISAASVGGRYEDLRRRRVFLDVPPRYC